MSSYNKLNKQQGRTYKERHQPADRAHLGLLEKKKDYKIRAEDAKQKEKTLKALKRKAEDRNPDEFYFNMIKTQKMNGLHKRVESDEPLHTDEQLKLMETQDLRYINYRRFTEKRKIEKLKSSLHLIDAESRPKNSHIIFVDNKKAANNFNTAKHFDTHPSFVNRAYNRPTNKMLKDMSLCKLVSDADIQDISIGQEKRYSELTKRIVREKELSIVSRKMETKIHLMNPDAEKEKMKSATKSSAAVYKWKAVRKR